MACFLVPMVQAIATTVYRKANASAISSSTSALKHNVPALEKMLWGGTVMLIVDHVMNGELTWRFPFFTALNEANGWGTMLHEMGTVGIAMSIVISLVWVAYSLVKARRQKLA